MINNPKVLEIYNDFLKKNPNEPEFHQAALEILESLELFINKNENILDSGLLERLLEPERIVEFRVPWVGDDGKVNVNRGYRCQFNSAIGPYKGGLRFHPSVNRSIIKFLALEQTLKNSLTTLPMGGAKGGSDFDPKGKSDNEIMRFCQSFMRELYRYIGPDTDVPAGDIGVGGREIGYLFGEYKKITNTYSGVLTGKGLSFGGSKARTEATGYGLLYFSSEALKKLLNTDYTNKTVLISGSGNVALYALKKATELGAKVVTMSDSNGWIYDCDGIDFKVVQEIKEVNRGRIKEYLKYKPNAIYTESIKGNKRLWETPCDIALPCATQNELNLDDAKALKNNGCIAVFEGANMPTTLDAAHYLIDNNIVYGPGKAANAGGVLVSGLEMTQNSMRYQWDFSEVDSKLKSIMEGMFNSIYDTIKEYNLKENDLLTGANITGFKKVSDAMMKEGII